jgi:transcriptional regulator with XRE-family HTH domain
MTKKRLTPDTILIAFGRAVLARRIELELSQEELAARAGLHRTYVGDIERGARNLALRNIVNLATALELTPDELFRQAKFSITKRSRS